jgi:hypothetical protein
MAPAFAAGTFTPAGPLRVTGGVKEWTGKLAAKATRNSRNVATTMVDMMLVDTQRLPFATIEHRRGKGTGFVLGVYVVTVYRQSHLEDVAHNATLALHCLPKAIL